MSVTKADLQDFTRFADEKLSRGEVDSLTHLADQWEAQRREADETLADIHQCHEEIDAGNVSSVAETFGSVRNQLDLE